MTQLYPFIKQLAQGFSLTLVCHLLTVSRSAFYAARKKTLSHKDEQSSLLVEEVFWQHSRRYGSCRIREELQAQGVDVMAQMFERDEAGFTEAYDPNAEPGEIASDAATDRADEA